MDEKLISETIAKLAKRQQGEQQQSESSAKMAAFETLMQEVSVALGDLVSAMEGKPGESEKMAGMLADAIRAIRPPAVSVASPSVNVKVDPNPVHNHFASPEVHINVPEQVVHIEKAPPPKGWDVVFKFGGTNPTVPTGMTLTRIN